MIMRLYKRFSNAWHIIGGVVLFWIAQMFISVDWMKEVTYDASLMVMFAVFATWAPEAWRILWHNKKGGPSLLILAVFLVSTIMLQSRAFASLNLQLGRPDWLYYSSYPAFIAYQIAIIGVLLIMAVAKTEGVVEGPYKSRLIIAAVIGAFICGVLAAKIGPLVVDYPIGR